MRIRSHLSRIFTFGLFSAWMSAGSASAAIVGIEEAGPRMALRLDPNQVVLGASAHIVAPRLSDSMRLVALGSVGFGDDETVTDLGLDLQYVFTDSPLAPDTFFYVGAGSDLSITSVSTSLENDTRTRLGLMLTGGVETRMDARSTFFGEFRMHIHEPGEWFEVAAGVNFSMPR
jgi:hypothetical protein